MIVFFLAARFCVLVLFDPITSFDYVNVTVPSYKLTDFSKYDKLVKYIGKGDGEEWIVTITVRPDLNTNKCKIGGYARGSKEW